MATRSNILNSNHPAYPVQAYAGDAVNPRVRPNTGMSMRDYFAAHALTGLLANPEEFGEDVPISEVVDFVYNVANQMLERREKL